MKMCATAANGCFEPTLPFFCIAAKVRFREMDKITSDMNGPKRSSVGPVDAAVQLARSRHRQAYHVNSTNVSQTSFTCAAQHASFFLMTVHLDLFGGAAQVKEWCRIPKDCISPFVFYAWVDSSGVCASYNFIPSADGTCLVEINCPSTHIPFETQKAARTTWRPCDGQGLPANRRLQLAVLAAPAKCPTQFKHLFYGGICFVAFAVLHYATSL